MDTIIKTEVGSRKTEVQSFLPQVRDNIKYLSFNI